MESRSMSGVSLIRIYFQPGTNANADVTQISNLAMADLRRLSEGTLPPVVMKTDASNLPVCLLTVEGQGLNETQLHDYLQYQIRNQIANVPGATVPLLTAAGIARLWSTSTRESSKLTTSVPWTWCAPPINRTLSFPPAISVWVSPIRIFTPTRKFPTPGP